MCAKYEKKKVYFGIIILLILINIISITIIYQSKIRFSINDQEFKYQSKKRNTILFKDSENNLVTINIKDRNNSYSSNLIAKKYEIEYKDKNIIVDNSNYWKEGTTITLSNGDEYNAKSFGLNYSKINKNIDYLPFDVQLVYKIKSSFEFAKDKSIVLIFLFTIPLMFLGVTSIMYPQKMWRFQYIFTVREGEPTDWAIISNEIGGIFIICVTLILPLILVNR